MHVYVLIFSSGHRLGEGVVEVDALGEHHRHRDVAGRVQEEEADAPTL